MSHRRHRGSHRRRSRAANAASPRSSSPYALLRDGPRGRRCAPQRRRRGAAIGERAARQQRLRAADAGLEWALARVNDPRPIGADMRAERRRRRRSRFATRMVRIESIEWHVVPRTWRDGGTRDAVAGRMRARRRRLDLPLSGERPPGAARVRRTPPSAPAFFVELARVGTGRHRARHGDRLHEQRGPA